MNIYTSLDDSAKAYVRNTGLWLPGVDLTCIPAYGSVTGPSFNGVLLTPDILLQANHAHANGTVYFVTAGNATRSRSIVAGTRVGFTDLYVSRLSSPLPSSITPAKVLPRSAFDGATVKIKQDSISAGYLPAVFTNQFRTLRVGRVNGFSTTVAVFKYASPPLSDWGSTIVSGDSGSPFFVIVNNQLVILSTWWESDLSSYGVGPNLSEFITETNAAITALGSATSLSQIDLSAYPTYSV